MKLLVTALFSLFLFQSCIVYESIPISLEELEQENRVKVVSVYQDKIYYFDKFEFKDGYYFGYNNMGEIRMVPTSSMKVYRLDTIKTSKKLQEKLANKPIITPPEKGITGEKPNRRDYTDLIVNNLGDSIACKIIYSGDDSIYYDIMMRGYNASTSVLKNDLVTFRYDAVNPDTIKYKYNSSMLLKFPSYWNYSNYLYISQSISLISCLNYELSLSPNRKANIVWHVGYGQQRFVEWNWFVPSSTQVLPEPYFVTSIGFLSGHDRKKLDVKLGLCYNYINEKNIFFGNGDVFENKPHLSPLLEFGFRFSYRKFMFRVNTGLPTLFAIGIGTGFGIKEYGKVVYN